MKLKIKTRLAETKKEINTIRREGNIPAVLYAKNEPNRLIEISGTEFHAHLRKLPEGSLPNTVFILEDEKGNTVKTLIKDIQYHVASYNILHLDFMQLVEELPVNVKVPIRFKGVADCVGVKLGGVIRQVMRHLKVRCLPKDIPHEFYLDVTKLTMNQSLRLASLKIPESVRPLSDLKEVAVTIAKR